MPDPMAVRRELAWSTVHMAASHPWLGTGLGTWASVYPRYAVFDIGLIANQAHNEWLQWTAEGGIPLGILLATLFLWSLRPGVSLRLGTGRGRRLRPRDRRLSVLAAGARLVDHRDPCAPGNYRRGIPRFRIAIAPVTEAFPGFALISYISNALLSIAIVDFNQTLWYEVKVRRLSTLPMLVMLGVFACHATLVRRCRGRLVPRSRQLSPAMSLASGPPGTARTALSGLTPKSW